MTFHDFIITFFGDIWMSFLPSGTDLSFSPPEWFFYIVMCAGMIGGAWRLVRELMAFRGSL